MEVVGHGGSNTSPRQSMENASEIVVQTPSEAHHAHWSCRAQEAQSVLAAQFGTAGHASVLVTQDGQGVWFSGPDIVPARHCKVDKQ